VTPRASSVLFFVRHPAAGQVKSRLAAVLGDDNALCLYRAFVEDMLETIDGTGLPCRICVHPPDAVPLVSTWLGPHRRYLPQTGKELGERMEQAFRAIFAEDAASAVLIGSDLPDLPAGLLREAFGALEGHDAVIGPARDGGYYLVGFRRVGFLPGIFRGMPWSGPDVADRTLERFREHRASVHILPFWQDVDTVEDLRDLVRRGRASAFARSRTMVYLADRRELIPPPEDRDAQV
jgi:rSAM/selenodomain-associated transferase 1